MAGAGLGEWGWGGALAVVWIALLVATVAYLGWRLIQSSRQRAADDFSQEAALATQALERSSQRMKLLEFVNRAGRKGWDVSGRSIDIMDLLQGLRQACVENRIRCWGRPVPNDAPDGMRTELHRPIPEGHWRHFEFDVETIVGKTDNYDTRSGNLKQSVRHAGGYLDIYVDGQAALDWLDDGAEAHRRAARS